MRKQAKQIQPKQSKQTSRQTNKQTNKQPNNQTTQQADKQTHRQSKQASKQTNKQTNRQANKQTIEAHNQTNTQTSNQYNTNIRFFKQANTNQATTQTFTPISKQINKQARKQSNKNTSIQINNPMNTKAIETTQNNPKQHTQANTRRRCRRWNPGTLRAPPPASVRDCSRRRRDRLGRSTSMKVCVLVTLDTQRNANLLATLFRPLDFGIIKDPLNVLPAELAITLASRAQFGWLTPAKGC